MDLISVAVLAPGLVTVSIAAFMSLRRKTLLSSVGRGKSFAQRKEAVIIQDSVCLLELFERGIIERILSLENVEGIYLSFERQNLSSALRVIESKLMTYQIELEYNPSNTRAKTMIEILNKLRNEIAKYKDPAKVNLLIIAADKSTVSDIVEMITSLGCKTSVKSIDNMGNFRRSRLVKPTRLPRWSLSLSIKQVAAHVSKLASSTVIAGYAVQTESIPIGTSMQGLPSLVYLPLKGIEGNLHSIVVGPTGRGKTYFLALTAFLASVLLGYNVFIVDPKGDLGKLARGLPLLEHNSAIADNINDVLCESIVNRRAGFKARNLLVVVDEAWRFSSDDCISRLFRLGRSRGISVIVASQQPEDIPLAWWNNASNIVAFGSSDTRYIAMVSRFSGLDYDYAKFLLKLNAREAIVKYVVSSKGVPVRIMSLPTIRLRGRAAEAWDGGTSWVNG